MLQLSTSYFNYKSDVKREAQILYGNISVTSLCKFYEGTTSDRCKRATLRLRKNFPAARFIATIDEPLKIHV
jgi:hypothetical protein